MSNLNTASDLAAAGETVVEAVTGRAISSRARAIVGGVAGAGNGLLAGLGRHVDFDLPGVLAGVLSVLRGAAQIIAASRRNSGADQAGPGADTAADTATPAPATVTRAAS